MSERRRCGCACSRSASARAALENMPMTRHTNPIPVCTCQRGCEPPSCCSASEELAQIQETLACQNQLLADLLGAVNSLTATLLAGRGKSGCS